MATPQLLQTGIRCVPVGIGILLASPALPASILRGPVGTRGRHDPAGAAAGAGAAGAGAA